MAMLDLAAHYQAPQPVRLKGIAEANGIPQRFLVQILLQLKGAGLVLSIRGASGGYQLARPPREISLAEIINAIDRHSAPPPPPLAHPSSPTAQAVRTVWEEIQVLEQRVLEEMTLTEMVDRTRQTGITSYQI
jgi:Rrf2 family protein